MYPIPFYQLFALSRLLNGIVINKRGEATEKYPPGCTESNDKPPVVKQALNKAAGHHCIGWLDCCV